MQQHTCFFFPLCKENNLLRLNSFSNSSWWDLTFDIEPKSTIISARHLLDEICRYPGFPDPPSYHRTILYDVSSDVYEELRRSLAIPPLNAAWIEQAPRILTYDNIPIDRCHFIIAVHPPLDTAPLNFPTLQSVPPEQFASHVTLPAAEVPPQAVSIDLLEERILIRAAAYDSLAMTDCPTNNIQTRDAIVPDPPEWVESFVANMSKRREIGSSVFQSLLQLAQDFADPGLARKVEDCFICNDGDLLRTSTGQNKRSRAAEGISHLGTLISSAMQWTELEVLDLFRNNFRNSGSGRRTHIGNVSLTLVAQKNKPLPNGIGIPVLSLANRKKSWYAFRPDAALLRGFEPCLLVEVESPQKVKRNDYARMLLYSASLVKWLCRVTPFRYILPLLYVYTSGEAELLYMYEIGNEIRFVRRSYSLNSLASRLELFVTIFNISDREPVREVYGKLKNQIGFLRKRIPQTGFSTTTTADGDNNDSGDNNDDDVETVRESSRSRGVDDMDDDDEDGVHRVGKKSSRKSKRRSLHGGGSRGGPRGPKRGGGGGGAAGAGGGGAAGAGGRRGGAGRSGTASGSKQNSGGNASRVTHSMAKGDTYAVQDILANAGYITVMDSGGDILTVKKRSRKFVVKIVRKKREQRSYDMHVEHPNVIKPEEIIRASDHYLAVLPNLVPLNVAFDSNSSTISKFYSMSHDLANGLQFLHDSGIAHLDIKPSNLVYHPTTFVLFIIDFNLAVRVKNLDEMITGHQGTLVWMAPEISQGIPYNPILADRYACGVVFHQMAESLKVQDNAKVASVRARLVELQSFSSQLMAFTPCMRPPLDKYTRQPLQVVMNR